jgi:hypothetical protein
LGKVFKPEDLLKAREGVIDEALRDLSPGVREATRRKIVKLLG